MVKTVVGDESQIKLAEDRLTLSATPSQVGLLIGKLSSNLDKGFVYGLVPTPPNESGDPPCSVVDGIDENSRNKKKRSSKSKPQIESSVLFIDVEWIAEHARQVSRMLLGGMKVVGIYVWSNETSFKNSTNTLCQAVKVVAASDSSTTNDPNERLLIHISYSPLRWTCQRCSLAESFTSSSLWPCDFKMGKVLGSLQAFRCTYSFDLRLPVFRKDGFSTKTFADVLRDGIMIHAKKLSGTRSLVNGRVVIEDDLCASEDFNEVEFLLPLSLDEYVDDRQKEVIGVIVFTGSICSLSYLNSKEPISQALVDIKEDIVRSMVSRLDMLCDEVDTESESITNCVQKTNQPSTDTTPVPHLDLQVQRTSCKLSFPRRAFIPWLEGTYICDYIQPSESVEVLRNHCAELISMELPTDASEILEPELESSISISSTNKSFWDVASSGYSSSAKPDIVNTRETTEKKYFDSGDYNMMKLGLLIVVVSIIVGLAVNAIRAS